MKKIFSYNKFANNDLANSIVDTMYTLTQSVLDGKSHTAEYAEANEQVNESFMKYCVESIPGRTFNSIEDVKDPMVHRNVFFTQTFNVVLAQVLTPVIPTVAAAGYEDLYDVYQVGFGDTAVYTVESNELFIVNSLAEGIQRSATQTTSNQEYVVNTQRRQVSCFVDWYHVAAGKQDWGRMCAKVGVSFAAYIQGMAAKAMASVIANADEYGIGGYMANGMTDQNWLSVARNVRAANGGADVYALGTSIALADVLPADKAGSEFVYGEDSVLIKKGFLPAYKNVPLIELGNAIVPNTINGVPELVLPDDIIFMLPMGGHRPLCDLLVA